MIGVDGVLAGISYLPYNNVSDHYIRVSIEELELNYKSGPMP